MARTTKAISLPRTRARSKAHERSTQRAARHDNGRRLPIPGNLTIRVARFGMTYGSLATSGDRQAEDRAATTIIRAVAVPAAACVAGMPGTCSSTLPAGLGTLA